MKKFFKWLGLSFGMILSLAVLAGLWFWNAPLPNFDWALNRAFAKSVMESPETLTQLHVLEQAGITFHQDDLDDESQAAGDEALAKEIVATYGKHLTPKPPRLLKGKKRPRGMAFFLEMIRSSSLRKDLIITDAVIEEAHDLNFDDYREARSKLEFLGMVPRLGALHSNLDVRVQRAYKEANQLYACPKVCLYQGRKLPLPHRMNVISAKHDYILTLHFAKLPGFKILVGWVEERAF